MTQALTSLEVPVDLNFDMLDGTTFAGLGDRIELNSAATLCRLAAYCYRKGDSPYDRIARHLDVMALPPVLHDKPLRDQFVALDEQAITSSEMLQHRYTIRPNHALDGPLGTIIYRQLDFYRTLDPETEIANEVAHAYLPKVELAHTSAGVQKQLITGLYSDAETQPLIRDTIEEIVANLPNLSNGDFVKAVESPEHSITCTASADVVTGENFILAKIDEDFLAPPETLAQATQRLTLLRTLGTVVDEENSCVKSNLQKLAQSQQPQQRQKVSKLLGTVRQTRRFWRSATKPRQLLYQAAVTLRSIADEIVHLTAIKDAFDAASTAIRRTERVHANHLIGIQTTLESFRPRGRPLPQPGSAVIREIEAAFPELSVIASKPREQQVEILCGQVVHVTVAGLTRVLELSEPRLELIAERIVNGPPRYVGPFVGSTRHSEGGQLVYALPPLLPATRYDLTKALKEREPNAVVIYTDSAAAGINVLRYRFFHPKAVMELFPGVLAHDLLDARTDPKSRLYFPEGDQAAADLGINPVK